MERCCANPDHSQSSLPHRLTRTLTVAENLFFHAHALVPPMCSFRDSVLLAYGDYYDGAEWAEYFRTAAEYIRREESYRNPVRSESYTSAILNPATNDLPFVSVDSCDVTGATSQALPCTLLHGQWHGEGGTFWPIFMTTDHFNKNLDSPTANKPVVFTLTLGSFHNKNNPGWAHLIDSVRIQSSRWRSRPRNMELYWWDASNSQWAKINDYEFPCWGDGATRCGDECGDGKTAFGGKSCMDYPHSFFTMDLPAPVVTEKLKLVVKDTWSFRSEFRLETIGGSEFGNDFDHDNLVDPPIVVFGKQCAPNAAGHWTDLPSLRDFPTWGGLWKNWKKIENRGAIGKYRTDTGTLEECKKWCLGGNFGLEHTWEECVGFSRYRSSKDDDIASCFWVAAPNDLGVDNDGNGAARLE